MFLFCLFRLALDDGFRTDLPPLFHLLSRRLLRRSYPRASAPGRETYSRNSPCPARWGRRHRKAADAGPAADFSAAGPFIWAGLLKSEPFFAIAKRSAPCGETRGKEKLTERNTSPFASPAGAPHGGRFVGRSEQSSEIRPSEFIQKGGFQLYASLSRLGRN